MKVSDYVLLLIVFLNLLIFQPVWAQYPPTPAEEHPAPLKVGVLAFQSVPETLERWQPLADYLSQSLDGRPVQLVAANYPDLEQIIARNELDFILTNPSHYIELRKRNFLSGALATMVVEEQGYAVTGFGGAIVSLAKRDDITALKDIAGKKIAAVSESSLGGYRAQAMALREERVKLPEDVQLVLTGMPHENAVLAVLAGEVDAGFARTGVVETMIAEGRLDPSQIKVLADRAQPGFPFQLSTRLYPEWPFVALAQVDAKTARKVAAALYLYNPDAATSQQMGVVGFGIPADYESVEHLARTLRLPPYDSIPVFGMADVWHQYRWSVVAGSIVFLLMAGLVTLATLINRRLRVAKQLLDVERTRLAGIITGTDVGTWEWNIQTGEAIFNERWADIIGYTLAELEPISIATWGYCSHPEDLKASEELLSKHFNGELDYYECECRMRHKNGNWVWVLDRGKVISRTADGKPLMMMGTHLDISERKNAALALQQKNAEMEQLIYSVSHDLKSPLITVKSFVGMLQQDIQDGNQQQITEDLKYIDSSTDKMQQLLNALLKYSRIGTVDVPAQTLSADHQVHNCLATLAGILLQHQVQVSTSDLPHKLHGDPLHFGQIWQNLIENAVKYRGDQHQPHIEIGATQEGHDVVFYVRDNGMGIAPEHRERIFNLFSQLNPGSDGSGLGLALVKKIVTIYGGCIWVESAGEGQGSCFMFTLPGAVNSHLPVATEDQSKRST